MNDLLLRQNEKKIFFESEDGKIKIIHDDFITTNLFAGIKVVYVKENMTSQICPVCGSKNKPLDRNYECKSCGFRYHRDGVGAINIYRKYTGIKSLVVGRLTCPVGVRYTPHLRCPVEWNTHPWVKDSTGKVA